MTPPATTPVSIWPPAVDPTTVHTALRVGPIEQTRGGAEKPSASPPSAVRLEFGDQRVVQLRARDPEPPHLANERVAIQPQLPSGTLWSADDPSHRVKRVDNQRPVRLVQGR